MPTNHATRSPVSRIPLLPSRGTIPMLIAAVALTGFAFGCTNSAESSSGTGENSRDAQNLAVVDSGAKDNGAAAADSDQSGAEEDGMAEDGSGSTMTAEEAFESIENKNPMPQIVEKAEDFRPLSYEVAMALTNEQWREILTPAQYRILREAGTEPPGSGPLLDEKRGGTYHCAACALPLYEADVKFDSGCGWPSFYDPFEGHVLERRDTSHGMVRVETICARCHSHLGHVFNDAPDQPTGLRYCMNSLNLVFVPNGTEAADVDAGGIPSDEAEEGADGEDAEGGESAEE